MQKQYSPAKNFVIPLNNILKEDKTSIKLVESELCKRGYTFIQMPLGLITKTQNCLKEIDEFFDESLNYKNRYITKPIFGYFGVEHKESFRFLTGDRMKEQKIPEDFKEIKQMISDLDKIMILMTKALSGSLFPKNIEVPLFNKDKKWGMFDIAKYKNNGKRKEINCIEHYDPGLLSFSICSTEEGLQLKDEFGKWIKPPKDNSIAILWAGDYANKLNKNIKRCVHRVVYPTEKNKPRIGIWYEVCVVKQEHKELIYDKDDVAHKLEDLTGLPTSKTIGPPRKFYEKKSNEQLELLKKWPRRDSLEGMLLGLRR